jgi:hypothetical protein
VLAGGRRAAALAGLTDRELSSGVHD